MRNLIQAYSFSFSLNSADFWILSRVFRRTPWILLYVSELNSRKSVAPQKNIAKQLQCRVVQPIGKYTGGRGNWIEVSQEKF